MKEEESLNLPIPMLSMSRVREEAWQEVRVRTMCTRTVRGGWRLGPAQARPALVMPTRR